MVTLDLAVLLGLLFMLGLGLLLGRLSAESQIRAMEQRIDGLHWTQNQWHRAYNNAIRTLEGQVSR